MIEAEYARLKALWDSGHPDREGIWRGYEDWILEECLELSGNVKTTVGSIAQLTEIALPESPCVKFEGGAQRSEFQPPYYLLEDCFLVDTSERMRKGELSHGRDNYKQGGPEFVLETYNHFMAHLLALREGDETDNHMQAICANAQILDWHWNHKRYNFALLQGTQPHHNA
jgi:hypothetical protein